MIRVSVRLRNAVDEGLVRRGQCCAIRDFVGDASVSPDAVQTIIPAHVAEQLGVSIRGERILKGADGRRETVGVIEPTLVEILDRDTVEEALIFGDEVMIGYTVLAKLDLLADCANRRLVPNPAHPDQPVTKVK